MKWFIAGIVVAVLGGFAYFSLMFTGPRMQVQPHIRTYEQAMPAPPANIVPVEPDDKAIPSVVQSMRNPIQDTPHNLSRGKIYYGYYCLFCHGSNGQGDGPVGYSYMPAPSDFHSEKILRMSDNELMRGMLKGTGHDPVLPRIVLPAHRWYLVTYIRALGKTPRSSTENPAIHVMERTPERNGR